MMTISAPTICMSSSRIPQPERRLCMSTQSPVSLVSSSPSRRRAGLKWSSGFAKNRGDSTFATRKQWQASGQASSSSSSSAEFKADASDDEEEVPAKDDAAAARNCTGTQTVEFVDSILPTKDVSSIDDQLPPLLSMVIDGFPPLQQSKYVHEAEKQLHQYAERYPNVVSLYSFFRVGLSAASYGHPEVISPNRLALISLNYALWFILDDLFYDTKDGTPNEFLRDEYGISHSACGSPKKIQEYLDYLDAIFSQQVQPCDLTSIETLMRDVGQETLELSNPEWFNIYVAGVIEHHRASAASLVDIVQGHNLCFQDVESYTNMRVGNIGGRFVQLLMEFAKNTYIPDILRANPYLKDVTTATSIHLGFENDVFSYHKESSIEQNPRNLITVLMECEGKPFNQALHMAIDLVNTYAREIMDLEARAWNSTLQNHLHDIKTLIAGSIYYSFLDKRYQHPNSVFPELRDMTSSWKILPPTKGSML